MLRGGDGTGLEVIEQEVVEQGLVGGDRTVMKHERPAGVAGTLHACLHVCTNERVVACTE